MKKKSMGLGLILNRSDLKNESLKAVIGGKSCSDWSCANCCTDSKNSNTYCSSGNPTIGYTPDCAAQCSGTCTASCDSHCF